MDFIIPVRHPDNMRNRKTAMATLRQTVQSTLRQSKRTGKILIVSNPVDDLAYFESECTIVLVDLPSNPNHDDPRGSKFFRKAVQRDKGLRLHAGLTHSHATYIMPLDDDDFLHSNLAGFVLERPNSNGWFIEKGFHWTSGSKYLFPQNEFHRTCGSCHIVRQDLLKIAISSCDDLEEGITKMLGSHLHLINKCELLGRALSPIPFRAAIKRRGHENAHSQTGGMDLRLFVGYISKTARQAGLVQATSQLLDVTTYKSQIKAFKLPPT